MKSGIHPKYNPVIFVDVSTSEEIITHSTLTSEKTREIDGVTHYVIKCDITSFTHPFFTGKQKLLDSEGRIDRFRRKYARFENAKAKNAEADPASEGSAEA